MARCNCGDKECTTEIKFDAGSNALWFTDSGGTETLMYLDPNTVVELMAGLKRVLTYMCEEGIRER